MISVVISYCTNDYRYLKPCIEQAKCFSDQIFIPVCDHFFDGSEENRELMNRSYLENPDVQFIEFAYSEKPYSFIHSISPSSPDWGHFMHSTSRLIGYEYAAKNAEMVLFLDVDEICDGKRFKAWLESFPYRQYQAIRFWSYFYFGSEHYRCESTPSYSLMIKKNALESDEILNVLERKGMFFDIRGSKITDVVGIDGEPLIHHYSWVRSSAEIQKKVSCWGHRHDRDWETMDLKKQLEQFRGEESVFRLKYRSCAPFLKPLEQDLLDKNPCEERETLKKKPYRNVIQTTRDDFLKRRLLNS